MEKIIKSIFSMTTKDASFFEAAQSSCASEQKYAAAVEQFSIFSNQKKQEAIQALIKKFRKPRQPKVVLSSLLLIDYVYSLIPLYGLRSASQPKTKNEYKKTVMNTKVFVSEQQLIKVYFRFLQDCGEKMSMQLDFSKSNLEDKLEYCQLSVQTIYRIIKAQFLINFLLKNSPNTLVVKLICHSMLVKISFDLRTIHSFLQQNLQKILQQHKLSFRINAVHQNMLSINSDILKLRAISKALQKPVHFDTYKVKPQIVKSIQIKLFERQEQKAQFVSSHRKIEIREKKTQVSDKCSETQGDTMVRLTDDL